MHDDTRSILNTRSVLKRLDCSAPTLYRRLADPALNFPRPRKICGTRSNGWDSREIDAWIAAQLDKEPAHA